MNSFGVDLKAFNASAITRTYGLDGGSIHEVFYVRGKFLQTVQNFQKTAKSRKRIFGKMQSFIQRLGSSSNFTILTHLNHPKRSPNDEAVSIAEL